MITNEKQLRITEEWERRFALAAAESDPGDPARRNVDPRLVHAEREGLESQLAQLRGEIAEYRPPAEAG